MRDGVVAGAPISQLSLVDVVEPTRPGGEAFPVEAIAVDVAEAGVAEDLVSSRPDVVFHLAAVLSGEAEADLEKGYRVNLDGTRLLLEAIRRAGAGYRPRVVFASSIAVFGAPFPEVIGDDYCTTPLTSYGTQKAIGELLLSDYSRRGISRRRRGAAADDLRAAGLAEPGRVGLLLEHHPRAAERRGCRAAGTRGGAPLVRVAARGGRLPRTRCCDRKRGARRPAVSDDARRLGDRGRADRCAAEGRRRRRCPAHPAGARRDDHADRRRLAGQLRRPARARARIPGGRETSRRSSASTSRTSSR